MGAWDDEEFGPEREPPRSPVFQPVVWLVIVLLLVSLGVVAVWSLQVNKAASELQNVTSQLQRTESSYGVGPVTTPGP